MYSADDVLTVCVQLCVHCTTPATINKTKSSELLGKKLCLIAPAFINICVSLLFFVAMMNATP